MYCHDPGPQITKRRHQWPPFKLTFVSLSSSELIVALTENVSVLRLDDDVRPVHAYFDLPAFTDLPNLVGIIAKRVLATELFSDAGARGVQIRCRISLEFSAAAVLSQRLQVMQTRGVFTRARTGRAAATELNITAAQNYPDPIIHSATPPAAATIN